MMTQADVLSQNEEFGTGYKNESTNILTSFTAFTSAGSSQNQQTSEPTAAVNIERQKERPKNLEFADLDTRTYLNEQSPIKPSKYLASDR